MSSNVSEGGQGGHEQERGAQAKHKSKQSLERPAWECGGSGPSSSHVSSADLFISAYSCSTEYVMVAPPPNVIQQPEACATLHPGPPQQLHALLHVRQLLLGL